MTRLLWQPYDEQGRPIMNGGSPKLKMVMEGRLHGSAHVWIWRKQGNDLAVLVQKRAAVKINWPGLWDKSAGGHMNYGEAPLQTTIRKAQEELGIELDPQQLKLVAVRRWKAPVTDVDMIENEFQWIYITELSDPGLHLPTPEVTSAEWKPLTELTNIADNADASRYVPYGRPYYLMLCDAISQMVQ